MSRLNRKLDLNVLSDNETSDIREAHVSQSMGEMKKSIRQLDLPEAERAPVTAKAVVHTPNYIGGQLADVARNVYRENINPKKEKEEYRDCGPDTHARRVNDRSIQRALMGLRNGGNEGKLSMVGPNGSGNVGKYSPSADQGSGNATNNSNNYYALTTDMTLEEFEEYTNNKFSLDEKKKKDDDYLETDMKKRQENNEKARKDLMKGPGMKNPHFEEVLIDLKNRLLQLEESDWQSIDGVMRQVAKEYFVTPKELHKEFKSHNGGQIPDDWLKENREVEMAGFVPLQELARLNPVGSIYNVTYMYRGGTQRQKFLVPHPEKPSKEEMEEYVRGFWPFARVMAYYPDELDNEQNSNSLVAVPPVTENYRFYTPEDWVTLSEQEVDIYNTICEEEGEPITAPEQQRDGTYIMVVADHDTGEQRMIHFGEGLTDDVRRQRGEDSPSNDKIRKQGASRDNAMAKLSQSDDFQKKMDAAIEKSIQRKKEDEKRRMQATGESFDPLEEEKDKPGKGSGSKDACYHKVKSRYSVWPSAYASGALVKCRQKGASNWGKSDKKEEFVPEESAAYNAKDPQKNPFRNKKPQDVSKAGKFQDTGKVVRSFTKNTSDWGDSKKAPMFTAMNTSSNYQPPTQGMKGRA